MKKQKGFGLLEILITLVLLGVGVAGLVSLARGMLSTAREGGRYEIAMRLAESKLDEFRNFNEVRTAIPPLTAYKDIATGSGSQSLSNDSYAVNWTVSNQYLNGGVWSTTKPATYLYDYPERKRVEVTVTWNDNDGSARTLQLVGAISPTGSFTSEETGDGLVKPREGPKVDYAKGSVPDVVAIELGDGNDKETSKPLPNISKGSGSSRTIQFDTATYLTTGSTSTRLAQQDMATVYCSCNYTGLNGQAYLPAVPEYRQSEKVQYWQAGASVSKPIGELNGNSPQEALCGACCREHYDVSNIGFAGYYDPLNTGRTSGKSNGAYMDACRFVRIDGSYTPAPDWHLVSLTTFSAGFLNDATNLANYRAYVAEMVKRFALQQKRGSNWSTLSTDPAIAIQDFNTWWSSNNRSGSSTALTIPVGTVQLISRGIYVDIMSPDYLAAVVYGSKANPDINDADLAKIPFQDVNMTLLGHWSSSSSNGTVTSQPIATIDDTGVNSNYDNNYYGTYSRGRLTANNTTYSGTVDNPVIITVKSFKNNFGLVGENIPPGDNTAAISTLQVSILAPSQLPTTNVNGVIKCLDLKTTTTGTGNNKVTVNSAVSCTNTSKNLNQSVSNGNVTCVVQDIGSPAEASYSCSGSAGSFFTLTLDKNKYQFAPASQSFTLPSSGTLAGGCVLMVSDDLRNANPSPNPAIPTSCNIQP
ncbi:prepilin-type N-terminal cleavage/methylation domain-containing protein [Aeromonas media]|uniref:type IV pilus modification PilV family protein n=1 Tax=Aeromonas media TaxID=651 RepID=UPI003D079132